MIKSKETALEISASSFLEKERELQSKIEELENKVEEFNQSIALQKVYLLHCWSITLLDHISVINITVLHIKQVDEDKGISTSNDTTSVAEENGVALALFKRCSTHNLTSVTIT